MRSFWENRSVACETGLVVAEKNLARIALIEMDQQRIPLETFGTDPFRLFERAGRPIEAAMEEEDYDA